MAFTYYTDLFSPETYESFGRSPRDVSGFRVNQKSYAERINAGDRLVCYMTKLSRWVGVLEVLGSCFVDETPLFYATEDPFIVRFRVRPVVWLEKELAIPIHESVSWDALSFTKDSQPGSYGWTGILRRSLNRLQYEDGNLLERLLLAQTGGGEVFPVDEDAYRRLVVQRVRRADKTVEVTVPQKGEEEEAQAESPQKQETLRESLSIQALVAKIGELMGFSIWIPRHDRQGVLKEWTPAPGTLIQTLPLNYDETTLQ